MGRGTRQVQERIEKINREIGIRILASQHPIGRNSHPQTPDFPLHEQTQVERAPHYVVDINDGGRFDFSDEFFRTMFLGKLTDYSDDPIVAFAINYGLENEAYVVSDSANDPMLQHMRNGTRAFIERVKKGSLTNRGPTPQEIMYYAHAVCFGESHIRREPILSTSPNSTWHLGELVATTHFEDLPCFLRAMAVHSVVKPFIPSISLSSGRCGILSPNLAVSPEFPTHAWTTFEDLEGKLRIGDSMQFFPYLLNGYLPSQIAGTSYQNLVAKGFQIFPPLERESHPPTEKQCIAAYEGEEEASLLMRSRNKIIYWDGEFNYLYSAPLGWHMCSSD